MGRPVTGIAGVEVLKRRDMWNQFEEVEVRVGDTDVTGHTTAMGRITANGPCHHFKTGNHHWGQVLFCTRLMAGRYLTLQGVQDGVQLDEINVIMRTGF